MDDGTKEQKLEERKREREDEWENHLKEKMRKLIDSFLLNRDCELIILAILHACSLEWGDLP